MSRSEHLRNVALAGHPGSGKTTLFEALLLAGGTIANAGSIERGSTVSDFDPMEHASGHSLNSAIASFVHGNTHINLIDTPGYPDFRGQTLSALAAVETLAVVVNASTGIEHGTRRLMDYGKQRGLARVLIVNRIDAGDDFPALIAALRASFGAQCLPINLPSRDGNAVVDCFFRSDGNCDSADVAAAHQQIIDQVVEINEQVMNHYLEEGETALSGQELHDAFEQCLREGHLVPICFVSARTGVGVPELLTLIDRLLPNPAEGNPPPFIKGSGNDAKPVLAQPDPDAHVIADVFKIINDPFVGKLSVFRIYQGTVRRDSQLFIDDGKKPFKVSHLFRMHGKDHVEIDSAVAGDIAAVAKVEDIHFDAILHDSHEEDHIHLKPLDFPKPMFGLAIQAATRGQEQKLATTLHKLAEEDPCFQIEHHAELNETVIRGLGELHLRVMLERISQRYGVAVTTRPPRIAYRETVATAAEGHFRHKKQTGGAGQFGEVFLRVEPLPRGTGFEFVDAVKGGTIPGQFIPAVEKGVRQAITQGVIAGYPIQDVRVVVHDGKHHPVDSKEIAFVTAGRKAFINAMGKGQPQLLEPIVELQVVVPESQTGDITGNLASKRARIHGTDASGSGEILIRAQVPLSEITDFATELKSASAGRGRYDIEFSHYDVVPASVQKQLMAAFKPGADED
ncbi:MAG: elongation factor G [Xanthomonadaceae bacterium]|nr:elongation factor G [Xanthomonadaceae bacterium]MDP2185271.1 elongation factor G [Xanthomonadales bacterium]MDZ4115340.1 elongation factor G [Xanthomonadaceae bacterium]MDZ4379674.1 elongation factor G [Xanthomonadaceae bacterium]